jgi:amidophosphoribosyltransferase
MLKESCGFFGTICEDENITSNLIYNGLISLQHRGQEACGISVLKDKKVQIKKYLGLVRDSMPVEEISEMKGNVGIGHVRYSTVGMSRVIDAQPFKIDDGKNSIVLAHNGNLVNYVNLRKELNNTGKDLISTCDAEIILRVFSEELKKSKDIEDTVLGTMERLEGSYSVVSFLNNGKFIAFRDPFGFRPFCYGITDSKKIFASESVALEVNEVPLKSDVKPGHLMIVDKNGKIEDKEIFHCKNTAHCMFEYVYFSRPDSVVDGKCVYDVRVRLGEKLAEIYDGNADVVVPVPDTSRAAAEGISRKIGLPVAEGLIKNRYIGRTFIMPNQNMRDTAVKMKMHPIKSVLKDKHVILVDDSIVRGTTSKKIVSMVKEAGAKKVDLWITCPPIISPCFYGIDISTHGELIAANNKISDVEKIVGVNNLCYQKIDGLIDSIGFNKCDLCMACLTGEYPTQIAQKIADKMKNQTSLKKIRYWEDENI